MIQDLRDGLQSTSLGLTWDDLAQFPRELDKPVSVLLLSGFQVEPNQPLKVNVDGRVIYWTDDLNKAEEFAVQVARHLEDFLIYRCVDGFARIELGQISVTYSGLAEEGDLEELETVTLTIAFPLTLTPSLD